MSSMTARLAPMIDRVKQAGLRGQDMQTALDAEIRAHDLSPNEIRRVAEAANRGVQIGLYKAAEDKRFTFKLADPQLGCKTAEAIARDSLVGTAPQDKLAAAINEADGDPFAPLPSALDGQLEKLSIYDVDMDSSLLHDYQSLETRRLLQELDRTAEELRAVKAAGVAAEIDFGNQASAAYNQAIQAAVDLVMHGMKLTDLCLAIRATVGGASDEDREHANQLCLLIIEGLKERGIPNHQMGFQHQGFVTEIDKLSATDLMALVKRVIDDYKIDACTEKKAHLLLLKTHRVYGDQGEPQHPYEDARQFLESRPTFQDYPAPAPYLDERITSNEPNGKPVVVNGSNEFTIAIKDLVGSRARLHKSQAANAYLGMKLDQISGMMEKLITAQNQADAEQEKDAIAPALAAAGNIALTAAPAILGALGSSSSNKKKTQPAAPVGGPSKGMKL